MNDPQFNQLMKKLGEISKKLNILISPQFKRESKKQDKSITRANIKRLRDCGLDYLEISDILDMKPGTVANELTYLNQEENKKKNAKKK